MKQWLGHLTVRVVVLCSSGRKVSFVCVYCTRVRVQYCGRCHSPQQRCYQIDYSSRECSFCKRSFSTTTKRRLFRSTRSRSSDSIPLTHSHQSHTLLPITTTIMLAAVQHVSKSALLRNSNHTTTNYAIRRCGCSHRPSTVTAGSRHFMSSMTVERPAEENHFALILGKPGGGKGTISGKILKVRALCWWWGDSNSLFVKCGIFRLVTFFLSFSSTGFSTILSLVVG